MLNLKRLWRLVLPLAAVALALSFGVGTQTASADRGSAASSALADLPSVAIYQAACPSPRPPVRLQTQALGDGKVQVTITAGAGVLELIRFGTMQNAHVEVPGSAQPYGSNAEVKPPTGATSWTFLLVNDVAAESGRTPPASTVPITIFDGCGPSQPWSTFVGGGPQALQSTASIADAQVTEGNAGNTELTLTITLSVPSSRTITVQYATADGTARAGQDYVAASGTVTFNPGETSKTVTVQVRGNFTAEPDKTFTVTLANPSNAGIGRAQATARILNDDSGPSASGDSYTATVGQTLTVGPGAGSPPGLLVNDQVGSQELHIVSFGDLNAGGDITSNPAGTTANLGNGGSLQVNRDGSFSFTPPSTFAGAFSFRYRASSPVATSDATVVIDVRAGPNAVDDPSYTVAGSTPLQVNAASGLLANDGLGTPPGTIVSFGGGSAGGSVTSTEAGQARDLGNGGSLRVNPDGSFSFTAPSTGSGAFTFDYRLRNDTGTDDATVTILVQRGPTITTTSGTTTFVQKSAAVVDAGATVTSPGNGNLTELKATITGLTDAGQELLAANTGGTAITAQYAAPTLTLSGSDTVAHYQQVLRSITYLNSAARPTTGARTIQFQGTAFGQQGNTATKQVTVSHVNRPPVAQGDTYSTNEDTPLIITAPGVLGNDSDPDGDPLTAILVAGPAHGTLTLNPNGSFTYTPAENYHGTDSFTYKVRDGAADSNVATVTITVNPVNDPSVAQDDAYSTDEDTVLTVTAPGILANDQDPEGATLQAVLVSGPSHGSLSLASDGSFAYTPAENYSGTDSFTYKANDGAADSNIATVTITVNPVNDRPQANTLSDLAAQASIPISFPAGTLTGTDPDTGALLTVDGTPNNVTNGTVSLASDGSFTFTPLPNAAGGTASFQYRVTDGAANSEYATVSFNVAGPALYFVKATAVGLGDCTLGNECTLATAANVGHAGGLNNARIFIGDANSHPSSVDLTEKSWLIGQGVSGASFDTVFGITPPTGPGAGTLATRPAIGTSAPTVTSVVNMGEGSNVRGLQISVTGSATGLRANGKSGLVVSDVPLIQSVNGTAVSMNNSSGSFAFTDVSATGSGPAFVFNNTTSTSTVTANDVTANSNVAVGIQSPGATSFTFRDVAAETGTGLVVSGGTGTLSFRSVSSGASANQGMNVNNKTGGSVAVTGDGSTAGSGGTITGKTGVNGQAVVLASLSATDVSLSYMTISNTEGTAIRVQNSSGTLTLDNMSVTGAGGRNVSATGFTGAVNVKNSTLSNSKAGEIQFTSTTSGTSTVTVSKSSLTNDASLGASQHLLEVSGQGTADVTVHVTESTITGNRSGSSTTGEGIHVQTIGGTMSLEVDNSSLSNHTRAISAAIPFGTLTAATLKANIHDNPTIVGSANEAISISNGGRIVETAAHARIVNNTIGTSGVMRSGSVLNQGIYLASVSYGSLTGLIQGNTIYEVQFNGIHVGTTGTSAATGTTDMTIKDNVVDQVRGNGQQGIVNRTMLGTNTGCADIAGNRLTNISAPTKIEVSAEAGSTYNVVQARPTTALDRAELDDANDLVPSEVFAASNVLFNQPTCAQPAIP